MTHDAKELNNELELVQELACPNCGAIMLPEHAHQKCPVCKFIEPCCEGGDDG